MKSLVAADMFLKINGLHNPKKMSFQEDQVNKALENAHAAVVIR